MIHAARPIRTAAPEEPILTLVEAKAHLRVLSSDEDDYITALISAAESHLDAFSGVLGRALVTQTWAQSFSGFPPGEDTIRLPLGNVQAISSVSYFDSANVSATFPPESYALATDSIGAVVRLTYGSSWEDTYERADAVTVTWTCGYGGIAEVPAAIVHAAKLLVAHWHERREAVAVGMSATELPLAVDALLAPYRVWAI